MSRQVLLVGNWKMHGERQQFAEVDAIDAAAAAALAVEVVLCPPATLIAAVRERASAASVGAQDCHAQERGTFTGGVSAGMLADAGADVLILGYSECRARGDSDQAVRDKVVCAGAAGCGRSSAWARRWTAARPGTPKPQRSNSFGPRYRTGCRPVWSSPTSRPGRSDRAGCPLQRE